MDLVQGSGAVVLAAGSGDELAFEGDGHGFFTRSVLQALEGDVADALAPYRN